MTRFVVDPLTAIRLVRERAVVVGAHQLVAPSLLRSQCLNAIYREARGGSLEPHEAQRLLDGVTALRIRLLGDRSSRAAAWKIAMQLGWEDTTNAEYLAVTQLQADAFITLDPDLARQIGGVVDLAPFEALLA